MFFFTNLREVENKNSGCSRATFTNLSFDIHCFEKSQGGKNVSVIAGLYVNFHEL